MENIYHFGIVLVIDAEKDKQKDVLNNTLKRIKEAIYADSNCKAFATDNVEHRLVEWDGRP